MDRSRQAAATGGPRRRSIRRRIAGEAVGVVDVLVAGEAAVDRLPQEAEQPVPDVLSAPALGERRRRHGGEAEGVVQLAVGEQAAVGGDPGAVELELEAAMLKGSGWREQKRHRVAAVLAAVEMMAATIAAAPPRVTGPRPGWGAPRREERARLVAMLNPPPQPRATHIAKPRRDER
jgi:hypothetical protein